MNNPLAGTDPSGYVANMGNDSPVDKHKTMSLIHRLTALQEGQGNGSQSLGDVSSGSEQNPSAFETTDIGSQIYTAKHTSEQGENYTVTYRFGSPVSIVGASENDSGGSLEAMTLGGLTVAAGHRVASNNPSALTNAFKFLGSLGARIVTGIFSALIPMNTTHHADGTPVGEVPASVHAMMEKRQKEAGRMLGLAIAQAQAEGRESITLFRTASPVESADIRTRGVFAMGPLLFPKQFSTNLADAIAFADYLPVEDQPFSIFTAQISLKTAMSLYPNTDPIRGYGTIFYLTAPTPKELNNVNIDAKRFGGIKEVDF